MNMVGNCVLIFNGFFARAPIFTCSVTVCGVLVLPETSKNKKTVPKRYFRVVWGLLEPSPLR